MLRSSLTTRHYFLPPHFRRFRQIEMPPPLHNRHRSRQFSCVHRISYTNILLIRRASTQSKVEGTPSWPAVPYSQLSSSQRDSDAPPSPPTFAFNGISTEPPKSFQPTRTSISVSDESLARKRALEEDSGLYPALTTSGVPYSRFSEESPVIPLSPDPFGRFPSQSETDYLEDQRHSQIYLDEVPQQPEVSPHDRGSLVAPPVQNGRPTSQTPSSRFSLDSVTSDEVSERQQKSTSTLMSVKSIRRLWRKSGNKGSISNPPLPESGKTSPNTLTAPPAQAAPQQQPVQSARKRSRSLSKQAPLEPVPPSPLPSSVPNGLQVPQSSQPVYRQLHFNQDSPYPIHPLGRSPPAPVSRELSPVPPVPTNPSPSPQPSRPPSVVQPSAPDRSSGVRKSILKSWKSSTGLHGSKSSISRPPSSSGTPRSSTDQLAETTRKRRPSVLDIATSVMRSSVASSTTLNGSVNDIPPSPALPEQFVQQMTQPRSASRQSQVTLNGDKRDSSKGRPSMSSSASSPPRVRSPFTAASPPRNGNGTFLRKSIDSYESRPSLDVSQFEIVSPRKDSYVLESTLSYPYHGLDHSMTSHE